MSRERVATGRRITLSDHYDVIVIGAGIYGAAHAWEAAARGLSVILLEKTDFGAATSANSLKTIHGGIRYLQNLNIKRVLESKRERDVYMRIAPHLVQPLACVMPSYAWTTKGKIATAIGAGLYNLVSAYDDLTCDHVDGKLRAGVVSKGRIQNYLPGGGMERINGGVRWYDAQAYDSERMVLAFVLSARQRGADIYNHMQVKELVVTAGCARGVVAEDRLDGGEYTIHGEQIIDASGPWLGRNHQTWGLREASHQVLAKAVNLVYPAQVASGAFGMKLAAQRDGVDQADRLLFAAPWRGRTIVGTWYFPVADPRTTQGLTPEEYAICNADARRLCAMPDDAPSPSLVHIGLVPVVGAFESGEYPRLAEDTIVTDHGRAGGPAKLISVCGVKYTTARATAERTIDMIAGPLGAGSPSTTRRQPLYGGDIGNYDEFYRAKLRQYGAIVDERILGSLLRSYGSSIDQLLAYGAQDASLYETIPGTTENIKAQIVFAVREELAQRLTDVMARRIGIGSLGRPRDETIAYCAHAMAAIMDWSDEAKEDNIRELDDYFRGRSQ